MKHLCPCPVGRERKVVQILTYLKFEAGMIYRSRVLPITWSAERRRKAIENRLNQISIMPGKVVVYFDGDKPLLWHRLCDAGIVGRGPTLKITTADIERMMQTYAELAKPPPVKVWKPGDLAKVKDGPMQGFKIIVKAVDKKSVKAMFENTLMRGAELTIGLDNLEAA